MRSEEERSFLQIRQNDHAMGLVEQTLGNCLVRYSHHLLKDVRRGIQPLAVFGRPKGVLSRHGQQCQQCEVRSFHELSVLEADSDILTPPSGTDAKYCGRHARLLKSAGQSMVGESQLAMQEMVNRDDK